MTPTLFRAGLASLLLIACGDPSSGADAGPPRVDAEPPEMDAGAMGSDAAADVDAARSPGAPDPNAPERWRAADVRFRTAGCECGLGVFSTMDECVGFGILPESDDCSARAVRMNLDGVGEWWTCWAEFTEELADCYEAADCDESALDACGAAAEAARAECTRGPDDARAAYRAAWQACVDVEVVGPAGTCPDDAGSVDATGPSVFTGSTLLAGDDLVVPAGCAAEGGRSPERAFRWMAPSDGTYRFDTFGSMFDTVLYLLEGCDAPTALGCNDDASAAAYLRSAVSVTLTDGQEVLVVVEGSGRDRAGDFVVNVTRTSP